MLAFLRPPESPRVQIEPTIAPVPRLPAFDDKAFTEWVLEHDELNGFGELESTLQVRRIAVLAWEFADFAECRPRSAAIGTIGFDGALFTTWMREHEMTSNISPGRMADYVAWHSLVLQRTTAPTAPMGKMLSPFGWHRYRGKQSRRDGALHKPTYYGLR